MGWLCSYSASYWKNVGGREVVDRQKECDRICTWESTVDGKVVSRHRVLKSAMVGSTYYAAVTTEKEGQPTKVWAAVFLTCGKGKDGTVWGYKDMDETMGPCQTKCPPSILALLTPTDEKWALEWREKCRQYAASKADERKHPKPLYAPKGVEIKVVGRSWLITSEHYRLMRGYSAVRFTKVRWNNDAEAAMQAFLYNYGTREQKAEWAATGRKCPNDWKVVA